MGVRVPFQSELVVLTPAQLLTHRNYVYCMGWSPEALQTIMQNRPPLLRPLARLRIPHKFVYSMALPCKSHGNDNAKSASTSEALLLGMFSLPLAGDH